MMWGGVPEGDLIAPRGIDVEEGRVPREVYLEVFTAGFRDYVCESCQENLTENWCRQHC